ncbi:MAG TPA: tryptophan synthase subunit alpha [Gemmatimonadetes bacterium]|nr:tryptophan synthase subunit alpha [Gemmatimonadota bacterium]
MAPTHGSRHFRPHGRAARRAAFGGSGQGRSGHRCAPDHRQDHRSAEIRDPCQRLLARLISRVFEARRAQGRAALVPYVTAGYPELDSTVPLLEALAASGGDVLELGIPFSDPLADGPTIQLSSFKSLENGTTVGSVLADVRTFRSRNETPVVLMTYLNPVLRFGVDAFLAEAMESGANGVLLTDLPTGADPSLEAQVCESALDLIRLVAPTTAPDRVPEVAEGGSGFLYYISRTGVTGAQSELGDTVAEEVRRVRAAVSLPVAVGFGISTPDQAAEVASVADGVVVGSALIHRLSSGGIDEAASFLSTMRSGMDAR